MNSKLPYISKGYGGIDFQSDRTQHPGIFLYGFFIFIGVFFFVLASRLFQLTVVKGNYYRLLSENNRVREIIIEPKRGEIVDRNGQVLAKNEPANINAKGPRLFSKRTYIDPEVFAPVIGYRAVADKNDFDNDPCLNKLQPDDKAGKKGVEKIFDCDLRGKYGQKMIEVDAHGNFLNTLDILPPEDGKTVHLALDADLQRKAYDIIKGKRAVVIGLKPKTGEVLVMASTPSFSPQDFENGNVQKIQQYFTDKNKPLFNRATEGTYPPGSVFKLPVAVGALEEKAIDEKTIFDDKGFIEAGGIKFGNWYYLQYGKTEGPVDIIKAIRRSNDTFFYQAGAKLTAEKLKSWAEKFGYERKTGIGLDEAEGSIPSPFWKEDVLKEKWYLGDTYNLAIGQGYVLATPIQVAQSTLPFANGGYICQPSLLQIDEKTGQPSCTKIPMSEKTLGIIREGMKEACSTGGTGWPLFDFGVPVASNAAELNMIQKDASSSAVKKLPRQKIQTACKTGTAESVSGSGVPYAWFTAFAPFNNPEIVITVLVEEGGQGSDVGGPIARDILAKYFEDKMIFK